MTPPRTLIDAAAVRLGVAPAVLDELLVRSARALLDPAVRESVLRRRREVIARATQHSSDDEAVIAALLRFDLGDQAVEHGQRLGARQPPAMLERQRQGGDSIDVGGHDADGGSIHARDPTMPPAKECAA